MVDANCQRLNTGQWTTTADRMIWREKLHDPYDTMESMNSWLQRFVEVNRKNAAVDPPLFLYHIVCGLPKHIRDMNVNDKNFLDGKNYCFTPFKTCIRCIKKIKDFLSKGLETITYRADPISHKEEELLFWVKLNGVFGNSSAPVFFFNCNVFEFTDRDKNRNLDYDQLEIGINSTGRYLQFHREKKKDI